MIRRCYGHICRRWVAVLLTFSFMPSETWAAPHEGLDRWFPCGIVFWGPCEPELENEKSQAPHTETSTTGPSREVLQTWGTPVAGPEGSVSYQLPPEPVLKMFVTPSEENARAYLAWQQQKALNREEAFAAIRRVAAEMGYTVGQPSASPDVMAAAAGMLSANTTNSLSTLHVDPRGLHSQRSEETTQPVDRMLPQTTVVMQRQAGETTRSASVSPTTAPRLYYFFSPTCPYCEQQTPLMNDMVKGRSDVVGIAMATTRDELMAYVQRWKIGFPVLLDQGESTTFGVTGYPVVVAIDRRGQVTRLTGLARRDELQRLVDETH